MTVSRIPFDRHRNTPNFDELGEGDYTTSETWKSKLQIHLDLHIARNRGGPAVAVHRQGYQNLCLVAKAQWCKRFRRLSEIYQLQHIEMEVHVPVEQASWQVDVFAEQDWQAPQAQVVQQSVAIPQTQSIDRAVKVLEVPQGQVPTIQEIQKTVETPKAQFLHVAIQRYVPKSSSRYNSAVATSSTSWFTLQLTPRKRAMPRFLRLK